MPGSILPSTALRGLIKNDHNTVKVANTIFETLLYNLFLSDAEFASISTKEQGVREVRIGDMTLYEATL